MTSSEALDKVVEELFELKDGTEDIDPEAVCSELFDPETGVDDVASGPVGDSGRADDRWKRD